MFRDIPVHAFIGNPWSFEWIGTCPTIDYKPLTIRLHVFVVTLWGTSGSSTSTANCWSPTSSQGVPTWTLRLLKVEEHLAAHIDLVIERRLGLLDFAEDISTPLMVVSHIHVQVSAHITYSYFASVAILDGLEARKLLLFVEFTLWDIFVYNNLHNFFALLAGNCFLRLANRFTLFFLQRVLRYAE